MKPSNRSISRLLIASDLAARAAVFASVLAFALIACCAFGSTSAWADASARTGSIAIHEYRTQIGGTQAGSGGEDAVLPADAEPLADVPLMLYQLSEDPQAANGFDPSVTVDSPPLSSFAPRAGVTDVQGVFVFDDLPRGVYLLVQGTMPGIQHAQQKLLIAVPMETATGADARWSVHVYPKSYTTASIAKQAVDAQRVYGVGDEASWRIVLPVPAELKAAATDGSVRYGSTLSVSDPLDDRLDFVTGAQVSLVDENGSASAAAFVEGVDYVESFDAATRTASWTFTDAALRRIADASTSDLVITLTTRVNEGAFDMPGVIYNDALASFVTADGAPVQVEVVRGTPDPQNPAHPRICTGGLHLDKVLDTTGEKLPGAVFKVARSRDDAVAGRFLVRGGQGGEHDVLLTTDASGKALLGGLAAGTYWLVEVQAPSYVDARGVSHACVRLTEPAPVAISGDAADCVVSVEVVNRLETPFDQVGGATWGALAKTGDAGLLAGGATALAAAVAAACALRRAWRSRSASGERTDES